MKNIIFIKLLFTPFILFAQLGTVVSGWNTNNGFETFTGTADDAAQDAWTGYTVANTTTDATATAHSGTYAVHGIAALASAPRIEKNNFAADNSTLYDLRFWYKSANGTPRVRIATGDNGTALISNLPCTNGVKASYTLEVWSFTTITANLTFRFGLESGAGFEWWLDDAYIRKRIGTQYIDGTSGNDTNEGSSIGASAIATIAEGLQTRGTYNTGVFVIAGGTYDETVTIYGESGFSISASGAATVTSIDFNNYTATVDLANLIITTKLNDSNVTYLNDPSAESILQHPEWDGWPEW